MPGQFFLEYADVISKALLSLLVLVAVLVFNRIAGRVVRGRIKDPGQAQTVRTLVRNAALLAAFVVIAFVWLGFGSNFTVAMGILGAGIAFASQEVIGSFAGYITIVAGNLYRIGDRVSVGDLRGDIVDIGILRTTLMEIGEWVTGDQYTGRLVTLANRFIFSEPVFNYTNGWPYIWDELMVPVTYPSDWRRAQEIMLDYARQRTADYLQPADEALHEMEDRFPVAPADVEPALFVKITDNWIELTLRYVVDPKQRRLVSAALHREILERFEAEPDITVASATFEIVAFPPLKGSAPGQ
jgi:small-conductance mechanosensitive channel